MGRFTRARHLPKSANDYFKKVVFFLIISQPFTPSALCRAVVNDTHPSGLQAPCLSWGGGGETTWLERSVWFRSTIEYTALDLSALRMLAIEDHLENPHVFLINGAVSHYYL